MKNNNKLKKMVMKILEKTKKAFASVWAWVSNIYIGLDKLADRIAPIAIKTVNAIKNVNDGTAGNLIESIITTVIPGKRDEALVKALRAWLKHTLPVIATSLGIVHSISQIDDQNEQLKAICNAINLSSDEKKNMLYHTLATMIIESLSDGKITWSEAIILSEYYYQNK